MSECIVSSEVTAARVDSADIDLQTLTSNSTTSSTRSSGRLIPALCESRLLKEVTALHSKAFRRIMIMRKSDGLYQRGKLSRLLEGTL